MYLGIRHKIFASVRTIIIFAFIVSVLLWIHLYTPIPPYPEGGGGPGMGLEVNLGVDEQGMGDGILEQPVDVPDFKTLSSSEEEKEEAEKVLTQDNEETENIELPPKNKPKKKELTKKTIVKKEKPKKIRKDESEKATEKKQKLNPVALFPPKKETGNKGITNKPGNQGDPNGTPGSSLYTGNGKGSGGGQGGGSGTGTGTGQGSGISFSLEGRNILHLQKPDYDYQSEGKVVVEITVDKNGKVTKAISGVKGSTTLDANLLEAAQKAALQSKFNAKPDATVQKGTITYRFVLQ